MQANLQANHTAITLKQLQAPPTRPILNMEQALAFNLTQISALLSHLSIPSFEVDIETEHNEWRTPYLRNASIPGQQVLISRAWYQNHKPDCIIDTCTGAELISMTIWQILEPHNHYTSFTGHQGEIIFAPNNHQLIIRENELQLKELHTHTL